MILTPQFKLSLNLKTQELKMFIVKISSPLEKLKTKKNLIKLYFEIGKKQLLFIFKEI